jgi:hypothetical protein
VFPKPLDCLTLQLSKFSNVLGNKLYSFFQIKKYLTSGNFLGQD